METSSSPECPVCLQCYDGSDTVPRVLPCGHSACQSCLGQLPQRFPQTIRCPACTQLVKFPSPGGPSSLPKNIDLLRLCDIPTHQRKTLRGEIRGGVDKAEDEEKCDNVSSHQPFFLPDCRSDEVYARWRKWVLPQDAISIEGGGKVCSPASAYLSIPHRFRENRVVSLVPLFMLYPVGNSAVRLGYLFWVINCLVKMEEDVINELALILRVGNGHCKVTETYGVWGNVEDGLCYLVCERRSEQFTEIFNDYPNGFVGIDDGYLTVNDDMSTFAMIGLDICEAVISLHGENLGLGCLGLSCVDMDNFGHDSIHLNEVLVMAREVYASIAEFVSGRKLIKKGDFIAIFFKLLQNGRFVSPEVLLAILTKQQLAVEGSLCTTDSASYGSDVWSLGCMLIELIVGKQITEKAEKLTLEVDMDFSAIYEKWLENVSSLLEIKLSSEFGTLPQMLCDCLNLEQGRRPVLAEVWKSLRRLLTKHCFRSLENVELANETSFAFCLILGKMCKVSNEVKEISKENNLHGINVGLEDKDARESLDKDFGESLSLENFKCKELRSHLDVVTGLAVGGGFLFSSSFDRTLQLWSLQDFSHVHTLRGHEHKITAVVYVDEEQPLCVTVDSGGGVFVWDIKSSPLGNGPLKKWYEEKDWRYSGIHSLAYSRSGYLYTGGGDKLIKAWTLQDSTLACRMEGHKSVVSSLVVSEGALYSGSWDGTVRLWCLSDHSPLTVLAEEIPGKVSSVLSVKAEKDLVVAAHENGTIKVWKNDMLMKSMQCHKAAIISDSLEGRWLFTGGLDRTINIQEVSDDEEEGCPINLKSIGSIRGDSFITALLSYQGMLFVGSAKTVKVYYPGKR